MDGDGRAADQNGVHTNAADAPPALQHQHAFLELGCPHRRAPACRAGPDDDEVKMLRHMGGHAWTSPLANILILFRVGSAPVHSS
jgi:hypothetical protein